MTDTPHLAPVDPLPEGQVFDEQALAAARQPFPDTAISHLPRIICRECREQRCNKHTRVRCPKCNAFISEAHIDIAYVGHAEVTDRLLDIDPAWTWEPAAYTAEGLPLVTDTGGTATLWARLTVGGVTRLEAGTAPAGRADTAKELVSDFVRRGAMRFGVALDLWAKTDLHARAEAPPDFAQDTITEAQVAEIRAVFHDIRDDDRRREVMAEWAATLPFEVSWTPKRRFVEVLNSAAAATKEATAVPADGRVLEARAAANTVTMGELRRLAEQAGCDIPAAASTKADVLLVLSEHWDGAMSPTEVADAAKAPAEAGE